MNALSNARTLGDVIHGNAADTPDKVAFEMPGGRSVTFADFDRRVSRLGGALLALGLRPGDRVAILSRNCIEYVEAFGASSRGLITVPLNWRLPAGDLAKLIQHSQAKVLIADEQHRELVEGMRDQLSAVTHLVLLGATRNGWMGYEELLSKGEDSDPGNRAAPQDVLCLIYTSGTTGAPKGVEVTHAAALGNARTAAHEMLGLTPHDHTMAVMPLFHAGGMWYHLFPSFATGCTTVILSEFEPGMMLRELQARRITNVHLVPTMIGSLLAHPSVAETDLRHLRLLFYAASSMPPDLLRRAMIAFPACGFAQAYGSTEGGVITILGPGDHRQAREPDGERLLLSCGRPFSGREVRIVDDLACVLEQGEIGEIEVRSPDLMRGYWRNEQATSAVLRDGWLKTGDLGHFDADGYLYIVDRKNDMIVTGGENVYPNEVEAQLFADPDVLEAAVFGISDPRWVEKVVAAVVLRPGATPSAEDILARLRQRLAHYKCPKTIFLTSNLPKSAVGKVLRKELRKQYDPNV
jgi:acyl-CoA synthetase (AMP-forming)/AMP-acid ligase II